MKRSKLVNLKVPFTLPKYAPFTNQDNKMLFTFTFKHLKHHSIIKHHSRNEN